MFCLCLYCIWVSLEEPRSWFCLSIYPCKQLSFILFIKLKLFGKKYMWSYLLASGRWKMDERGCMWASLWSAICCPTGDRHTLECTVRHRLYLRPFLSCCSLIVLLVSHDGVLRLNRMGKQWNRPWAWHFKRHSRSRWCSCFWNLA